MLVGRDRNPGLEYGDRPRPRGFGNHRIAIVRPSGAVDPTVVDVNQALEAVQLRHRADVDLPSLSDTQSPAGYFGACPGRKGSAGMCRVPWRGGPDDPPSPGKTWVTHEWAASS